MVVPGKWIDRAGQRRFLDKLILDLNPGALGVSQTYRRREYPAGAREFTNNPYERSSTWYRRIYDCLPLPCRGEPDPRITQEAGSSDQKGFEGYRAKRDGAVRIRRATTYHPQGKSQFALAVDGQVDRRCAKDAGCGELGRTLPAEGAASIRQLSHVWRPWPAASAPSRALRQLRSFPSTPAPGGPARGGCRFL